MLTRVYAIHIENNEPQTDRLVIVASIDADGAISDGECYGFVVDDGKDRYPFIAESQGADLILDYGAYGEDEEEGRLNLVGKRLRVGDTFTRVAKIRGDPQTYEYTYRVESIT